jgi:hypothetical protein
MRGFAGHVMVATLGDISGVVLQATTQ